MDRIKKLLNEKNHYLEKFLTLNEEECVRIKAKHYDNLDRFYQDRERILEIIKYIDSELNRASESIDSNQASEAERSEIKKALHAKDEYVARILDQDLEVLSCIEKAKSEIILGLRDVRKKRKAMTGYKTGVNRPGMLNEEY